MPTYELVLIFQRVEQAALKEALKRSANYIFNIDGTLRNIENLGFRNLPYSISVKGKNHKAGHFFIFNYDASLQKVSDLTQQLKLDLDVVKVSNWLRARDPIELHIKAEKSECTRYLDLLPPPQRPSVLAIQEAGKKKQKKKHGKNFDDFEFLLY